MQQIVFSCRLVTSSESGCAQHTHRAATSCRILGQLPYPPLKYPPVARDGLPFGGDISGGGGGRVAIFLPIQTITHPHNPMFHPNPCPQATQSSKLQPRHNIVKSTCVYPSRTRVKWLFEHAIRIHGFGPILMFLKEIEKYMSWSK